MKKKAISSLIATVLLIGLSLLITSLLFVYYRSFISIIPLPTENACREVKFKAEMYEESQGMGLEKFLAVANLGSETIKGFILKNISEGRKIILGTVEEAIESGRTANFNISNLFPGEDILVVPKITVNEKNITCPDNFGVMARIVN